MTNAPALENKSAQSAPTSPDKLPPSHENYLRTVQTDIPPNANNKGEKHPCHLIQFNCGPKQVGSAFIAESKTPDSPILSSVEVYKLTQDGTKIDDTDSGIRLPLVADGLVEEMKGAYCREGHVGEMDIVYRNIATEVRKSIQARQNAEAHTIASGSPLVIDRENLVASMQYYISELREKEQLVAEGEFPGVRSEENLRPKTFKEKALNFIRK